MPCLVRSAAYGEIRKITLGHPLLDDYLAFVAVRARTNTWLAVASDLKIFFGVVAKEPTQVTPADVLGFLAAQRAPHRGAGVVRLEDAEPGLAARTIARRLSSVRGLYAYLAARGDTGVSRNPLPTSLAARRSGLESMDEIFDEHTRQTARLLVDRSTAIAERIADGRCAVAAVSYKLAVGEARLLETIGTMDEPAIDVA